MSNTRGMLVLGVVFPDGPPEEDIFNRLETVFLSRFNFLTDFEIQEVGDGTVYFNVDYMPVHAPEARGCQEEMAAYIEAFLHGAWLAFETIGD